MKLTPHEKLAREICWAGFSTPEGRAGKTKASYWRTITEETRQDYREQANCFIFVLSNVSADLLNEIETFHIFRAEDWKLDEARSR